MPGGRTCASAGLLGYGEGVSRSIEGFRFAGVSRRASRSGAGSIWGLILADEPVTTAAVFTQNLVRAHPLEVAFEAHPRRIEPSGSGQQRQCQCLRRAGQGPRPCWDSTEALARALGCPADHVLPASTGVIGVALPSEKVSRAVPQLLEALESDCDRFSQSILTTDRFTKVASTSLATDDGSAELLVIAKGAGMIHPGSCDRTAPGDHAGVHLYRRGRRSR